MKKVKTAISFITIFAMLLGMVGIPGVYAESEAVEPTLNIAYCNLSYNETIYIKYAVKATNADKVKMLIWTEPQEEYVLGTQTMVLNQVFTENINGEDHMIYNYTKLAAKQMADVIYARAYTEKDGVVYYSDVNKYSILQYAYNMLGKTGVATEKASLKALLENMLIYGASAQTYFEYEVDRLVTKDYFQVKVKGGWLDDLCCHGLYLPGDQVAIHAPETDGKGGTFAYWINRAGDKVADTVDYTVTVGEKNEVYTPYYLNYSTGLEFESNGDGTCYVVGMGDCTDVNVVIPPVSPDGDVVMGIDGSAFSGEEIVSIYIPDTVEEIGRNAFKDCDSLTDVYYGSSEAMWEEISVGKGNDLLLNANIHFAIATRYDVTFVDYDGAILKVQSVKSGTAATAPEIPGRLGYTFSGWDTDFSAVAEDLTVTAQYTGAKNQVYVSYVENGDSTVTAVFTLCGDINVAAMELQLSFDLTYASYQSYEMLLPPSYDYSVMENYVDGQFLLSLITTEENLTGTDEYPTYDLFSITFLMEDEEASIRVIVDDSVVVEEITNDDATNEDGSLNEDVIASGKPIDVSGTYYER